MKLNKIYIYSFYRFLEVKDKNKIKIYLDEYFKNNSFKGTILLADEGINGSVASSKIKLDNLIKYLKQILNIKKINIRVSQSQFIPFKKIRVRLKKEIVSFGFNKLNLSQLRGKKLSPQKWKQLLKNKRSIIIDTRNNYEVSIGTFKNSINPNTDSFREFPKKFKELKLNKNDHIGMFCTGGIRCEKASAFVKSQGYKNVYQLDGGILNYFDIYNMNNKEKYWKGECFVFDDRVTVKKNLKQGTYLQCYGCKMPIKNSDTKSYMYVKGVSCKYCFETRTKEQKKRSISRQMQIDISERNKTDHPFKKITSRELL